MCRLGQTSDTVVLERQVTLMIMITQQLFLFTQLSSGEYLVE